MPAAPSSFAVVETAVLHKVNGALSNKAAVSLSWTINEAGATHRIEKQKGSGSWSLAATLERGVATTAIAKLDLGSTYNFRIRSEDSGGQSAWVTGASATTGILAVAGTPPSAPTGFAISSITGYQATASWEDTSANEAYFEIEVRRGTTELHSFLVDGLNESARLALNTFFPNSPNSTFTARVRALGGKGTASVLPNVGSDWSSEITFTTGNPSVQITAVGSMTAEQGQAFSFKITTNTACTSWTADSDAGTGGEQLPAGLTRSGDTISGTLTAAPGVYAIALTATDGTTTGTGLLSLRVTPQSLFISSTATARAPLEVAFTFQLTARRNTNTPALTWAMDNAPAWLSLNTATGALSGTPHGAGEWAVAVSVTDGTRTVTQTLTITAPALAITSAEAIVVFAGEQYVHTLTATSTAAVWTLEEGAPAWVTLAGNKLTIAATQTGTTQFDVTAELGEDGDTQTLTVIARPLLVASKVIRGKVGVPVLDVVRYDGACTVAHWYLAGAPAGVTVAAISCAGPYTGDQAVVAIGGAPTEAGSFEATLAVQVCCGGIPRLYSRPVIFEIE